MVRGMLRDRGLHLMVYSLSVEVVGNPNRFTGSAILSGWINRGSYSAEKAVEDVVRHLGDQR